MPDLKLKIEHDERGNFFFLKLIGAFSGKHILSVRKSFEFALEIGHSRIALDLSEVVYLDSMGIGIVMNMFKKLDAAGGRLVVFNPSKIVDDIFEVSNAEMHLEVHRNIENFDDIMA